MNTAPIVFGPVPSRRLGRSLGINNVPPKTCSYGCVYCQVGPSSAKETVPRAIHSVAEIADAVSRRVQDLEAAGERIDYLTFVPDGEPTLDMNLGEEIEALRPLGLELAVITNASLLWQEQVRAAVYLADWVSVKVDAVDVATWRHINHPHPFLDLDQVLEGIVSFSAEFGGKLTSETMLVNGINDGEACVKEIAGFVAGLGVTVGYLAVPTRPPAVPGVRAPSAQNLNRAFQVLSQHIDKVELLIGYEGDDFTPSDDIVHDLLGICAVHPMRRSAVERLLALTGNTWSTLEQLVARGLLVEAEFDGHRFYLRPISTAVRGRDRAVGGPPVPIG